MSTGCDFTFQEQSFIPFVQERGPMGDLLKCSKTQRSRSSQYKLEPILIPLQFPQKTKTIKSDLDPLMYLFDQETRYKLNHNQSIMLNSILKRREKNLTFQNLKQSFVTQIPLSPTQINTQVAYSEHMKPKLTYLQQIIQTKKRSQSIDAGLPKLDSPTYKSTIKQHSISRLSPRFISRVCLVNKKKQSNDNSLDFIDYSLDIIKPKGIVNVHISETKRKSIKLPSYQPLSQTLVVLDTSRQKKTQNQQNETDNMFQRMIMDINKQVKREQLHNQNNFLIPGKKLNFKELQGNFATENYQKMKQSLKKVQEYRGNLKQLSKKMEDVVNFRRYGGVRDKDEDEYVQQGRLDVQ